MERSRAFYLFLSIVALSTCATGLVSGRDVRQRAENILTEQLFVVQDMLEKIRHHAHQLDDWNSSVSEIQSRLAAVQADQMRDSEQLDEVLRRLQTASEGAAAGRPLLTGDTSAQPGVAETVTSPSTHLTDTTSSIADSAAGLVTSEAALHELTRGACLGGGPQLAELVLGLRAAASRTAYQAGRTEEALSGGLERLESRLEEVEQLLRIPGRERPQERLTTSATPAPTLDPLQRFLDSLLLSLNEGEAARE